MKFSKSFLTWNILAQLEFMRLNHSSASLKAPFTSFKNILEL